MSVETLKETLIRNDQTGIIIEIEKWLSTLKNLNKQYIYLGVTHKADENIRKEEHIRRHGSIEHRTLQSFASLMEDLMA